jgi:hypothetical protein
LIKQGTKPNFYSGKVIEREGLPVKGTVERGRLGDVQVSGQMPKHRELHMGLETDFLRKHTEVLDDVCGTRVCRSIFLQAYRTLTSIP